MACVIGFAPYLRGRGKRTIGVACSVREPQCSSHYASIASLMRFLVSCRLRSRFPVALAIALAIDAAAGPCPVSPLPRNGWPGRVIICNSMLSGDASKFRDGKVCQSTLGLLVID